MVAVQKALRAPGIEAEESALNVLYAAREKESRIHELERDNKFQLAIKAARSDSERRDSLVSRQRLSFGIVFGAALALGAVSLLLLLLLRGQRRQAAALRAQALIDPLTGVENRRRFVQRVHAVPATSRPPGSAQHASMLVDLDHFKRINDSGGHSFGDLVLCGEVDCMLRTIGTQ